MPCNKFLMKAAFSNKTPNFIEFLARNQLGQLPARIGIYPQPLSLESRLASEQLVWLSMRNAHQADSISPPCFRQVATEIYRIPTLYFFLLANHYWNWDVFAVNRLCALRDRQFLQPPPFYSHLRSVFTPHISQNCVREKREFQAFFWQNNETTPTKAS